MDGSAVAMRAQTVSAAVSGTRVASRFRLALRAHAIFFAVIAVYTACCAAVLWLTPDTRPADFLSMALSFFLVALPIQLLALVTIRFIRLAAVIRPERPAMALARDLVAFLSDPRRLLNGLLLTVAMFLFMQNFSLVKDNIPIIVPFAWDEAFMQADRWLHLGRLPHEWLQPLLGYAPVTYAIGVAYNLWFMVMWMMWVGLAFVVCPSELRTRFFLAFMGVWAIGGSLAAVLFSSAGPCFWTLIGLQNDPYAAQMAYLHGVHAQTGLWALDTQEMLWASHIGQPSIASGISAMPSMHNAAALLFALAGWKIDRRLGVALSLFAALIFVGSIHLAWHYAVDAYLGFAITLLVWWASGPIARWWEATQWARDWRVSCERG